MKRCFTLAEVLITIVIIGIVAALTIPTIITGYQDKQLEARKKRFDANIINTMGLMYAKNELGGTTTSDFLSRFSKYQKVLKTCDSNNLTDCFPEKFMVGDVEVSANNLKTPASLGLSYTNDNNVGIVLMDGASIILSYNPKCSINTYSTGVISCMHMVVDLDGKKGANQKGKDIVLYAALDGLMAGDLINAGCWITGSNIKCSSGTPVINLVNSYGMSVPGWSSSSEYLECNCSGECSSNSSIVTSCTIEHYGSEPD